MIGLWDALGFVVLGIGVFTLAARFSDYVHRGTRTLRDPETGERAPGTPEPAPTRATRPPTASARPRPVFREVPPAESGTGSREAYARMAARARHLPRE